MSHFREILALRGRRHQYRRSKLFSVPSDVEPLPGTATNISVSRCDIGSVVVGEVVSSGHDVDVREPLGATMLLPVRGRITTTTDDGVTLAADAGNGLFLCPNRRRTRVDAGTEKNFLGIPVIIPMGDLEDAAERLGVRRQGARKIGSFALPLPDNGPGAMRELIGLVGALYSEASRGSPRLVNADARTSWSQLLCEKLVEALDAAGAIELPDVPDGGPANRHVRRAMEFMRAHYGDVTTIGDVARACGISTRTLEGAFRSVLGMPPQRFLTEIRLTEARRMLLADTPQSVTEIALHCGFTHHGRFSASYRNKFGEHPSNTAGWA